jgi:stearoyl-CoA desaturase (delta-9 desaturase)
MSTTSTAASDEKLGLSHWLKLGRFAVLHLICLAAIWTGVGIEALILCGVLYAVRIFGVTGGYHRYFAHRTYKMGRVMQFFMAFLAQTSAQKGVIWWAAHHRHHHKYSDEPEDVHSALQDGFWWSHIGWICSDKWADTDESRVKDLLRYPELKWLDKFHWVPPTILGVATFFFGKWTGIGGWEALVVGFFWSTVLCWHGTFTINSLAHMIGGRRYETDDASRNNWFLALITFGEGWHNNHHHYQASVNQGFFWWEFDITYYILKAMSWVGLVSDLRTPPEHVIHDEPHPRAKERARKKAAREAEKQAQQEVAQQQTGQRWLDELEQAAMCRYVELSEAASRTYEELCVSAKEAQESASKRLDEISEAAHIRYVDMSESASRTAEEIKMSAREAQEEAARKVDEWARSLAPQADPEGA